ncbi:putative flavin-nucleotide-binding protein [Desulfosporosinus acidiphilus SJ4]|uniref:Putative flavin-nucleotide-binding protein n=1 Tax=Desulfosporosinus acidiphilus (strain DSM 22704 / JCM 16185 / SJ4) TaxID=646529 RepID=I4D2E5_DESAJ|nr:pyridoxamine 5'-phosphate oxidase family protein [Desulfosporosinus acidiphilus]AFM39969.1 putative flavin-nucleotide-binding protein [Desulfosporosinus acidiphilus SJ4]
MRREDKEITDQLVMNEIMRKAQVCRLGVSYNDMPYIIPMSFGYDHENRVLYFHSAPAGLKLLMLKENPQACFEVDVESQVVPGELACDWTMRYQSVIGFGEVQFIEEIEEKQKALRIILQQYTDRELSFKEEGLAKITIFKLNVFTMTGKKSGY